jgi:hypothetical protein
MLAANPLSPSVHPVAGGPRRRGIAFSGNGAANDVLESRREFRRDGRRSFDGGRDRVLDRRHSIGRLLGSEHSFASGIALVRPQTRRSARSVPPWKVLAIGFRTGL